MTPKEKAKELVGKYYKFVDCGNNKFTTDIQVINAKECALIAVDEILEECRVGMYWFWQEVKEEIEKL